MNFNLNAIKKEVIFLVILSLVLGFSATTLAQNSVGKILPGRIDERAAFSAREDNTGPEANSTKFPEKFWVFLFGVYLFLLVFNLSFGLKKKKKQWFWELFFTLLALWTWKNLDPNQNFRWFYYCILESGVIIYLFYAHSLSAAKEKEI